MPLQRFNFAFKALCIQPLVDLIGTKRLVILAGLLTFSMQPTSANSETTPQRVISLAPHITEMLFSAGAGDKLVGVVDYSNYPKAALEIENIGRYDTINIEKIIQLNPNLIVAWKSGNRLKDIEKLQRLGFTVIFSEPYQLTDIPKEIKQFGKVLQTQSVANTVANQLTGKIQELTQANQFKPKVRVFYQIWNAPMMTINGQQFISQAMKVCGAQNIFYDLPILAAEVNIESVIQRDPDVILLGGEKAFQQAWFQDWQKWPSISAVKNQHIFLLNADTYQRSTERLINGIENLCQIIDKARQHPK